MPHELPLVMQFQSYRLPTQMAFAWNKNMSETKHTFNVFLCYAHIDREVVHNLYISMKEDGINAWLDSENLQPGQDWQREIHRAILKSDAILVCLSREFNKQHGFRYEELRVALRKAKSLPDDEIFVIPVRLEKCDMPESLRHLHRVDLFEAAGYKKLVRTLRRLKDSN